MPIKCLKNEKLLEFVTIKESIPILEKINIYFHLSFCKKCRKKTEILTKNWKNLIEPNYDITKSLLRVFSRLQNDETLILGGWKLGHIVSRRPVISRPYKFAIATVVLLIAIGLIVARNQNKKVYTLQANEHLPYIKYRVYDTNKVTVHYIEPELIQNVEFETSRAR